MKWLAAALTPALCLSTACAQDVVSADAPAARPTFQSTGLGEGPWSFDSSAGELNVEVVASGLERPWGMVFLPDGGMLVTERVGRLRYIAADGTLDPEPITGLPNIYSIGIAGLKGIALDPNFAENRMIYMAYSKAHPEDESASTLALMRARWDGGHELSAVEDIFVSEPWYGMDPVPERCCGQGPAFGSFGGRVLFDDDGFLYLTSGDRNFGEMVQDPSNDFGKLFRMNRDGSAPAGNPWFDKGGKQALVWSTGHRNPLGLAINPFTGELWESEFGPRGGDELNRILRGGNYGWMQVTQGNHYDGTPAEGIKDVEGMIDPVIAFGPPSFNPGNLSFVDGEMFSGWRGNLLLGSFTKGVVRYDTDATGMPIGEPEYLLAELNQRWRDVQIAPDGAIYLLTDDGKGAMLRVTPAQ